MRKVVLTFWGMIWVLFASAQRATGYGRGYDWEGSPSGGTDYFFLYVILIILAIGLPIYIVSKIREKMKLSSGEYIKVVKNGYIVAAPSDDSYLQQFQVIQVWKLDEFENKFGSFKYNEEKINISRKRLVSITCNKGSETIVVGVGFECDAQRIFNDSNDYRVVKVKNGNYILCHK